MLQNATGKYYDEDFWNLKVSVHGGFESVFWNYQNLIKGDISLAMYRGKIVLWNQGLPLYSGGLKSQRTPVYQQELFNGHLYIFHSGRYGVNRADKIKLGKTKKGFLSRPE